MSEPRSSIEAAVRRARAHRRAVIESDAVIVAAGSWSSGLGGVDAVPEAVKPIRGQLLQLRLHEPLRERVIWGSNCYLVPRRDGTRAGRCDGRGRRLRRARHVVRRAGAPRRAPWR